MKALSLLAMVFIIVFFSACTEQKKSAAEQLIIAQGQMPAVAKDNSGKLHLVFGTGDSIMYTVSTDNGISFSTPALIDVLPELVASHTRGPQITASDNGLTVIACNGPGNIFCYTKNDTGKWKSGARVNDVDTVSKEGLMALSGDGQNTFAVWLDLRDKHNKIFGAKSNDGGASWLPNSLIYASPDSTVCECCKPSVLVKGTDVYVMFRNWLNGNRDLYLMHSADAGKSFGQAQKLGNESWALNGCPMDGGSLAIDNNGNLQTVWRRQGKIFLCEPGKPEIELGEGKGCTMELIGEKKVYAWTEKGEVICLLPGGKKELLGKGQQPIIKIMNDKQIICIWEDEKQIHRSILQIL